MLKPNKCSTVHAIVVVSVLTRECAAVTAAVAAERRSSELFVCVCVCVYMRLSAALVNLTGRQTEMQCYHNPRIFICNIYIYNKHCMQYS